MESEHINKFFKYIQSPNFDIASDAAATFKVEYGWRLFLLCFGLINFG